MMLVSKYFVGLLLGIVLSPLIAAASRKLDELPTDILDHITSFSHPLDVVHLRMVNRSLRDDFQHWNFTNFLKSYANRYCNKASIISLATMLVTERRSDPVFDFFKQRPAHVRVAIFDDLLRSISLFEADYLATLLTFKRKLEYLSAIETRMSSVLPESTLSEAQKLAMLHQTVIAAIDTNTMETKNTIVDFIYQEHPRIFESKALFDCVRHGREDLVRLLLDFGANPNARNNIHQRVLFVALSTKHANPDVVRLLLDRGAMLSPSLYTAGLFKAVLLKGSKDVSTKIQLVTLLLEYGANISVVDRLGNSPLHVVRNEELAKVLIEHGADVNQKNAMALPIHRSAYPLDAHIKAGHAEIVELLLRAKAKSEFSYTDALATAAYSNHLDVARILLRYDRTMFPWDIPFLDYDTPLHGAAWSSLEMTRLFLFHGYLANAENSLGRTPLHRATYRNHLDVMNELLIHKANPNIQDANKDAPLHFAVAQGNIEAVELLLKYKANTSIPTSTLFFIDAYQKERWDAPSLRQFGFLWKHEMNISVLVLCVLSAACSAETFSLLVKNGAPLKTYLHRRYNILHVLASIPFQNRFNTMIDILMSTVPELADDENEKGNTPLCEAIVSNQLHANRFVRALLDRDVSPSQVCGSRFPIHVAADIGSIDVGMSLLKKGANVNQPEPRKGRTALQIAIAGNNIEFAKMLMSRGAR